MPGVTAAQLAARHREDIVLDDLGRRCLPRDIAREIIGAYNESQRVITQNRQARRQRSAAQHHDAVTATRRRLAARRPPADPTTSALQHMMGREAERRLDAVGARNEAMRRGESTGRRYSPDAPREDQWNR